MIDLQFDNMVYGILGLPEDVSLFDATPEDMSAAIEQLKNLNFTGKDLLNVVKDWLEKLALQSDQEDLAEIEKVQEKIDSVDTEISSSPEDSGAESVEEPPEVGADGEPEVSEPSDSDITIEDGDEIDVTDEEPETAEVEDAAEEIPTEPESEEVAQDDEIADDSDGEEPEAPIEEPADEDGEVEPESDEEIDSEPEMEPEVDGETDIEVEPDGEVDAETDIEVEPESDEETDVEIDDEVPIEDEETDIEVEPESDEETDIEVEPESDEETDIEVEPESDEETDIEVEPESDAETDIEVEPESDEETDIEVEPESAEETDVEIDDEAPIEDEEDPVEEEVGVTGDTKPLDPQKLLASFTRMGFVEDIPTEKGVMVFDKMNIPSHEYAVMERKEISEILTEAGYHRDEVSNDDISCWYADGNPEVRVCSTVFEDKSCGMTINVLTESTT